MCTHVVIVFMCFLCFFNAFAVFSPVWFLVFLDVFYVSLLLSVFNHFFESCVLYSFICFCLFPMLFCAFWLFLCSSSCYACCRCFYLFLLFLNAVLCFFAFLCCLARFVFVWVAPVLLYCCLCVFYRCPLWCFNVLLLLLFFNVFLLIRSLFLFGALCF